MIDKAKLAEIIAAYKESFPKHWKNEKYKWEAIRHFQKHWDINAADFKSMLEESLSKTYNLLTSGYFFAKSMIVGFAEEDPEATRAAFMTLYDETRDLEERVAAFQAFAEDRKKNHNTDGWKNHYQNTNSISTYLWLKYPDKYYIYKYSEYRAVSKELESDFKPKKVSSPKYLTGGYALYDEICAFLHLDSELKEMLRNALDDKCYPDPELRTLTIDVGFFISRYYSESFLPVNDSEWWPSPEEYSPGFSKEKWLEILKNPDIIGPIWGGALAAFYEAGGEATCAQIAKRYNKSPSAISGNCTQLAKRIHKEENCPLLSEDDGQIRYWPILFLSKNADTEIPGNYIWKLRPELYDALTEFDIMRYQWLLGEDNDIQYWWLNANPKIWSFSDLGVGEIQSYTLYNENGNKRRIFQNFLDAKTGDMVIGYESTPVKQIVAIGRVTAEQDGENLFFEKVEGLASPIDYSTLKDCPELENMEYFQNAQGSLFKLTKEEYDCILDLIREENPVAVEKPSDIYAKGNFLNEVYMSENQYNRLESLLRKKKNVILQGAPGVGKTFAARRLAWAMMGEKDDNRIELIQFHQNYSYEDFIMGYKPVQDGFELQYGVFYRFCQKAANRPDKEFFFIIDEINRGNMSKIFGELLMLIENDYRGEKATLAYNGLPFSVPNNLNIIGMMNTADRSLAMIDYALRRRFSFFEMDPGFDSVGFKAYQESLQSNRFDALIEKVKALNLHIKQDKSLGKGFCIGHSYFCGCKSSEECTDEWLCSIVDYDLIPTLSEYWFDDSAEVERWSSILRGVFDD